MGWNLCIATEEDREKAIALNQLGDQVHDDNFMELERSMISLSRHFTYELLNNGGQLWKHLTPEELRMLTPDYAGDPTRWRARNPKHLLAIIHKAHRALYKENEHLPLDHFLWFVDEGGKRRNGSTQIILPFVGIKLKVPQDPIIKLDGGHNDLEHRYELRKYKIRIDPDQLVKFNREVEKHSVEHELDEDTVFFGPSEPQINPFVEEPAGWVKVQPVLNLLGCRVEVETIDAQSALQPDIDQVVRHLKIAVQTNRSLYWLGQ